jgi:hypothetical protein
MGQKIKDPDAPNYPGPGRYNQFTKIGQSLILSTSQNPRNCKFNPLSSKRFDEPSTFSYVDMK